MAKPLKCASSKVLLLLRTERETQWVRKITVLQTGLWFRFLRTRKKEETAWATGTQVLLSAMLKALGKAVEGVWVKRRLLAVPRGNIFLS